MQTTRWYRLLVFGMLALPISSRAQGPQPKIKEIAPGRFSACHLNDGA